MRAITFRLSPHGGDFGNGGNRFAEHGIAREAIHDIRTLSDDTVVMQLEVSCEPARVRRLFDGDCPGVLGWDVTGADGNTILQLHFEPSGAFRDLVDLHQRHAVVVDYPIEYVDPPDPTVRMVEVGQVKELRAVIEEVRELACVTIEEVGSYEPLSNRLFCGLTDRQQQVLRTAIERGYYDVPRDVTYEDIARDLDCSASTVGQHLRRIEARILSKITPVTEERELASQAVN
jgi:DNA-binding CsgD family transcriptional regulator